jgi:hydroxyacylglutathione hydrolase
LWIQEEGDVALAGLEVFDVVGEDGVQVAGAVWAGEGEVGEIIFVDEGDGFFGDFVFLLPVAEVVGERAAEPDGEVGARGFVVRGERSFDDGGLCTGGFHLTRSVAIDMSLCQFSAIQSGGEIVGLGGLASKPRDLESDRGYREAQNALVYCGMADSETGAGGANKKRFVQVTIPVGMLQCNCTILGDLESGEALVVDPGDETERILELLARHKLKPKAIVSTHAHIDHVGGLTKLRRATGAPVMMHREDLALYQIMDEQAAFLGMERPETGEVDQLLKEGDVLRWGGFAANVMHTPGHTPGSISIYLPKSVEGNSAAGASRPGASVEPITPGGIALDVPQLFAGDTLFAGSIGRTDLWGGSMKTIMDSLRGKLMQLPDETVVHPGHGPWTTIGEERESNPFLAR